MDHQDADADADDDYHHRRKDAVRICIETKTVMSSQSFCTASFPGGLPALLRTTQQPVQTTDDNFNLNQLPRFILQRDSMIKKRMHVLGQDAAMNYSGILHEPTPESKLCVGMFDKHTGKLILYPSYSVCLQQSIRQNNLRSEISSPTQTIASVTSNPITDRTILFQELGSAKKQRVFKSQEANRVDANAVLGSSIQQYMTSATAYRGENDLDVVTSSATLLERATLNWRRTFLPPYDDQQAKDRLKIFKFSQFAGKDAWNAVGEEAERFQSNPALMLRDLDEMAKASVTENTESAHPGHTKKRSRVNAIVYASSILSCLKHLLSQAEGDAERTNYRLRCGLLCHYISRLYLHHFKKSIFKFPNLDSSQFYMGIPVEIVMSYVEAFCTTVNDPQHQGYVMSKANIDKCRIHILLLILAAHNGFNLPLTQVAGDLMIPPKDASHLLRLAGCTIDKKKGKGSNELQAKLTLPITFPEVIKAKRSRKQR